MKIIHLFLLVVGLIVRSKGQCTWRGTAPFCTLSWCEAKEFQADGSVDSDQDGFGKPCWTGWKKLCCKLRSCYISSRFLCMPSSCKDGDVSVAEARMGDGSYCYTGWQKFCFSGLPSRQVKVTLYEDRNHQGAMESYDEETHCINVRRPNTASSVETHGSCVRAFNKRDCEGHSISLSAGSPGHDDLDKRRFHDAIMSIGPCLTNDHARGDLINRRWDPKFLDEVVIFGHIPHLMRDRDHVEGPVWFFQTGHGGRTESMLAMISPWHLGTGSPPTNSSRNYVQPLGRDDDDAELILGAILGGSGTDKRNLFPQGPCFDRNAFAHFEGMVADMVSLSGAAHYSVNLQYQGTETRPKRIFIRIYYTDLRFEIKTAITSDFLNP